MDIARLNAAEILLDFERNKTYPNLALNSRLKKISDLRDKKFVTALVYGVIEKRLYLDYCISLFSSVKLKKIDAVVLTVLRMGVYQIMFMDVPPSAACNTSVNLAKQLSKARSAGFVNAVLRTLCRERGSIVIDKSNTAKYLSIYYSVSEPVVNKLIEIFGAAECEKYLDSLKDIPQGCYLAVNTLKTTALDLCSALEKGGADVKKTRFENLLYVKGLGSVEQSELYRAGLFHVIGYPSYIAASLFKPKPKAVVMDMCASPGGKTFVIAEGMPEAEIYAFDIHEHKISLMQKQAGRLGINNIIAAAADAANYNNPSLYESADYVLCDVPCSGMGMLHSKPDIKYKSIDFGALTSVQLAILENAAKYLKPGGMLVYSTCTVNPDENDRLICKFLKKSNQFCIDETVQIVDNIFGKMTFLPHKDITDGFYIACLTKK